MEGIIALILAGAIFRTPGTWPLTRAIVLLVVLIAILYGYTPLRPALGWAWSGVLLLTLAVWATNVVCLRRAETRDKGSA